MPAKRGGGEMGREGLARALAGFGGWREARLRWRRVTWQALICRSEVEGAVDVSVDGGSLSGGRR